MKFSLHFDCDNAAFEDATAEESARILREIAGKLESGKVAGSCRDGNGNLVGAWELESEDEA